MKRQRQTHEDLWQLFVQACGNRCTVCGEAGLPLHRGHIQRKQDDGRDDIENLIPICKGCNSAHNRSLLTPDNRPHDWRARLVKRLIGHFGLRVYLLPQVDSQYPKIEKANPAENKVLINLDSLILEPDSSYLPRLLAADTPATPEAIQRAVTQLIRLGRNHDVPPALPNKKAKDDLHRLAKLHGTAAFLTAGREFLRRGEWYEPSGDYTKRLAAGHEWESFAVNFDLYLEDAKAYARAQAAEAAEAQRQRDLAAQAAAKEAERKQQPVSDEVRQSALAPIHEELLALQLTGGVSHEDQHHFAAYLETPAIETVGEFENRLGKLSWRISDIRRLRKLDARRLAEWRKEAEKEREKQQDDDGGGFIPEL